MSEVVTFLLAGALVLSGLLVVRIVTHWLWKPGTKAGDEYQQELANLRHALVNLKIAVTNALLEDAAKVRSFFRR